MVEKPEQKLNAFFVSDDTSIFTTTTTLQHSNTVTQQHQNSFMNLIRILDIVKMTYDVIISTPQVTTTSIVLTGGLSTIFEEKFKADMRVLLPR